MKSRMLAGVALIAVVAVGCSKTNPIGPDRVGEATGGAAGTEVRVDPDQEQGGRGFATMLTGAAEKPGPGDPDGSGTARLSINVGVGEVCFQLSVTDILLPATGAHIHVGDVMSPGPVVVGLVAPDETGTSSGCVGASPDLLKQIVANPAGYYVNVHSTDFLAGAVRGQLSASSK